nr:RibD C-terminal domain protein [uncultured bacterium]
MNVFIIAAVSVDGFIAEESDQISTSWTSEEDRKFFVERTKQARVMVMGSTTYKTIGRPLPGRLSVVYSKDTAQFSEAQQKYDESQLRVSQEDPAELIKKLEREGFDEVAICGGASIYSLFMKAGVVNKLYITLEPVIFGKGVKLFQEGISAKLKLIEMKKLNDHTLLLDYDVLGKLG